jgi:hypothetical protein
MSLTKSDLIRALQWGQTYAEEAAKAFDKIPDEELEGECYKNWPEEHAEEIKYVLLNLGEILCH